MNTSRYIRSEIAPGISIGTDELASVEFRTQTRDERTWAENMLPRQGYRLECSRINNDTIVIAQVPTGEPIEDANKNIPPLGELPRQDLEVVAAQAGVDVKPTDHDSDVRQNVGKARQKVSGK